MSNQEIVEFEGYLPGPDGQPRLYSVTVYPVIAEEMGSHEVIAKFQAEHGPQKGTWRVVRNPLTLSRLKKAAMLANESERQLL